jgi:hypothetical protein
MSKKILLITVPMGGYEKELIRALEKKGFTVDFFSKGSKINRKELTLFQRVIRGINKNSLYIKNIEKEIYRSFISKLDESYDYVFDFGGKAKIESLKILKEKYNCPFIVYMWDDLKYAKTIWETMEYFDEKYIFNTEETEKYDFKYRPNFYVNEYLYKGEEKIIDVYYRGSLRDKKRTYILQKIGFVLENYKIDISLYAKGNYLKNIKKIHSKEYFLKNCDSKYVQMDKLAENYKKSKVLLDIAYKNQSGLGLRPLEAIASNCKLITTNENIKKYEFYNENNIFYLKEDLSNINDLKEFMKKEFVIYSDEVKYKYSIDGFVDDIFGRK